MPTKHGMTSRTYRPAEYIAWDNMIGRCRRTSTREFHRYGGRGIKVFKEWEESFIKFYKYVGRKPSQQHSLDRIDPNKGYEPGNVRWATPSQQNANKSAPINSTSGYKGVSLIKRTKKTSYRAYINYRGKQIHIGTYDTPEEAANMYDQYARQIYKEFARLNYEYC